MILLLYARSIAESCLHQAVRGCAGKQSWRMRSPKNTDPKRLAELAVELMRLIQRCDVDYGASESQGRS